MRNLFSDSDWQQQLQYKALVMLIDNEIAKLRSIQFDSVNSTKLRKEILSFNLLEIYSSSLYVYLIEIVGLKNTEARNEVDSILAKIGNMPKYLNCKFQYIGTPINLETEEYVEPHEIKESKIINLAISELYNYLISKMRPELNSDGTHFILNEILKFNKQFKDDGNN